MMKRNGFAKGRSSAAGAAVGMALAICVYLWDVVANALFGVPIESVTALTYLAGMIFGFPLGWLTLFLVDWWGIAGVNEHLLILFSIVANWVGLGYAWSYLSCRK
jgi:hypothetical protein